MLGYTVEAKRAGDSTWTVIAKSCHSLSQTVPSAGTSSVAPGETYRFRVRAGNIHGLGEPGMESDPVRIPRQGETMFQEEEEGETSLDTARSLSNVVEGIGCAANILTRFARDRIKVHFEENEKGIYSNREVYSRAAE